MADPIDAAGGESKRLDAGSFAKPGSEGIGAEEDDMHAVPPGTGQIVKAITPGFRWAWDWCNGHRVVLMGPSLAGKTRLLEYFYTRQFQPDDLTLMERLKGRTTKVDERGLLVLRVGQEPGILLRFRAVLDSPGVAGANHAAALVDRNDPRRRPHVVIVVLNGTNQAEAFEWIDEFSTSLGRHLRESKINELFVVISRYDKVESTYEHIQKRIDVVLTHALRGAIGENSTKIKIFPLILIRHPQSETRMGVFLNSVANSLYRGDNLLKKNR